MLKALLFHLASVTQLCAPANNEVTGIQQFIEQFSSHKSPVKFYYSSEAEKGMLHQKEFEKMIDQLNIKSIDDLIPALPLEYRKQFTLMIKSSGNDPAAVDKNNPRVILFGHDGRLILTYITKKDHPDYEKLFILTFEDDEKIPSHHLFEYDFGAKKLIPAKVDQTLTRNYLRINQPQSCLECHRTKPKKGEMKLVQSIWNPYHRWPGALPEDEFFQSKDEMAAYYQLIDDPSMPPRFTSLFRQRPKTRDAFYPGEDDLQDRGYMTGANTKLTALLLSMKAKQLAALIRTSPQFEGMKKELAYLILRDPSASPSELYRDTVLSEAWMSEAIMKRLGVDFSPEMVLPFSPIQTFTDLKGALDKSDGLAAMGHRVGFEVLRAALDEKDFKTLTDIYSARVIQLPNQDVPFLADFRYEGLKPVEIERVRNIRYRLALDSVLKDKGARSETTPKNLLNQGGQKLLPSSGEAGP